MKSIPLARIDRKERKTIKAGCFHWMNEKNINNIVNMDKLLRKSVHKVVVIFSELRSLCRLNVRKNTKYRAFTSLSNRLILFLRGTTAMKWVEYCLCNIRRKSKRALCLWTACIPKYSHLVSETGCINARALSAMNERGNLRYIAKLRLMKGENA